MSLPAEISSSRLRLPLVTPEEAADMIAGRRHPHWHADYPRHDDQDAATMVRGADPWGPRHVVRAFDGLVVGSIGFYGPPDQVGDVLEAEIGYGLVADARGRGVATEAVRALLQHADAAGVRVRASVVPGNAPSLRVLAACGFTDLRGSNDEGELVMARPLPVPA